MGNNLAAISKLRYRFKIVSSLCTLCCRDTSQLSTKELELLEEFFKLSEEELDGLYKKFRSASAGQKSLSRRKFSDIMNRCFPRTHKVVTDCNSNLDIIIIYFINNIFHRLILKNSFSNFMTSTKMEK